MSVMHNTHWLCCNDKKAARWQVRSWHFILFYLCYLYLVTLVYTLNISINGTFRTLNWILQPVAIIKNSAMKNSLWDIFTWVYLFNWNNWIIAENWQAIFWDESNNFNFHQLELFWDHLAQGQQYISGRWILLISITHCHGVILHFQKAG